MRKELRLFIAVMLIGWAFRLLPKDSKAKLTLAKYIVQNIEDFK
jgi:hypothetical protein